MKLKILSVVVAIVGGGIFSSAAMAGDADFTLVNKTGYTIRSVHIAPPSAKTWGNDRLGEGTLEHNKARKIKFSDKARCVQSLNITFDDDDSEVEWEKFNLCEINKITLKYNRKTGEVSADEE